jgi:hypothetical protein
MTPMKYRFSLSDVHSVHIFLYFSETVSAFCLNTTNICSVLNTVYSCPMGQSKNKLGRREELLYCELTVVNDDLIADLTSAQCL